VKVRDPADAIGRLTRWNSGTDGNSPDGRRHVRGRAGVARLDCASAHPAAPRNLCDRQGPFRNEVGAVFTGIVEELGEVVSLEESGDSARLTVRGRVVTADASAGDSIAVNGVCLTVTGLSDGAFSADVMGETLRRSSLGSLVHGSAVNLERPLRLDGRLGGHLVQGHVDGTGTITERRPGEHWHVMRISVPPGLARYVVEKGSITIDGVSLTVSALGSVSTHSDSTHSDSTHSVSTHGGPDWVEVSLIPETLSRTTLGIKQPGETVNLEVDMIAKYVERLVGAGHGENGARP
jgi:riboflavin synthase